MLQKPLQKYGRLKKMGLPERYRLFFRVFKEQKIIIILWLGFSRKEGDKKDCYTANGSNLDLCHTDRNVVQGSISEILHFVQNDTFNPFLVY
ncbi:type II toxin-antitoxin system YhaV family toxin [Anabaena cylindrica UHCC 0172]|uniref:type II toxin-antitoxin system YhaV family toxin n=1 Tax=Anabaena cylindrica TaxID=1165 RepID=UPI002B20A9A7|nr:type II toxin-antitoxin system YhaV family toxin [Anabaena cylindrica]MEA5552373.1 type II toxin-antitoxin system YhaV family toxin [Anabaena cylindrica UHCC 0172]